MKRMFPGIVGLCLFSLIGLGCGGCFNASKKKSSETVTIWHWMTDRDKVFQELAQRYEQQTGIKVKFELFAPSDVYSQRIIANAQSRSLPDIFGILDKKEILAEFIKSGFVADLTTDFYKDDAQWMRSIFPKALSANQFEENNIYGIPPGIYGVPIDVTNIQMLYNKKLLQKAGISKPPATFEELLAAGKALKQSGVSGFVSGWGELWMAEAFASNYAFNIMGEDKIMSTYRGEVPYTDPDWIKVFKIFQDLAESGVLAEGVVTKGNKYAEQDFALERAGFAYNGSWCVNVYHGMNPNLEYGAMLPPVINPDKPMKIWGTAGSSFVINNTSLNKEKAVAFLKWMTDTDQQTFLTEATKNLPSNRQALKSIPAILSEFASAMDSTTHPTTWPINEDALVLEAFDKGIQSIIIGEKTPEQAAQDVQTVKEKQLKKQKR